MYSLQGYVCYLGQGFWIHMLIPCLCVLFFSFKQVVVWEECMEGVTERVGKKKREEGKMKRSGMSSI